jgi:hypothetical protein
MRSEIVVDSGRPSQPQMLPLRHGAISQPPAASIGLWKLSRVAEQPYTSR